MLYSDQIKTLPSDPENQPRRKLERIRMAHRGSTDCNDDVEQPRLSAGIEQRGNKHGLRSQWRTRAACGALQLRSQPSPVSAGFWYVPELSVLPATVPELSGW